MSRSSGDIGGLDAVAWNDSRRNLEWAGFRDLVAQGAHESDDIVRDCVSTNGAESAGEAARDGAVIAFCEQTAELRRVADRQQCYLRVLGGGSEEVPRRLQKRLGQGHRSDIADAVAPVGAREVLRLVVHEGKAVRQGQHAVLAQWRVNDDLVGQ